MWFVYGTCLLSDSLTLPIGAAGNFLAPIESITEKGFRTIIEIDTVGSSEFEAKLQLIARSWEHTIR
jgi:hypothetical protein